jgi:chemotaxis protein MotB
MPADRIASVGFGSARPIASGGSAAALAKNRRVDVVVLSDQPESIRSLIPMVVERDLANREPPAKVDLLPRGLTSR